MSEPKDGGPAFPGGHGCASGPTVGMSLRDYFAAKALQGFASTKAFPGDNTIPRYAEDAYKLADAMIEARKCADI